MGAGGLCRIRPSGSSTILSKGLALTLSLALLICFAWLGEWLALFLEINIPGPVTGMLLLFVCLSLYPGSYQRLNQLCDLGIRNLTLLFVPAFVGLFFAGAEIHSQLAGILGMILVSTLSIILLLTGVVSLIVKVGQRARKP
jgi:holin-like protein